MMGNALPRAIVVPSDGREAGRGFTLIELLAVVLIGSMVISLGAVSLRGAEAHRQMTRTLAGLRSLDALARMHARCSATSVTIIMDDESRAFQLTSPEQELLAQLAIPAAVRVALELPGHADRIIFDARGRSVDYAILLRDDSSEHRLQFAGLTGDVQEVEVSR